MATLEVVDLGKTYPGEVPVVALHDVNLRIEQGEYVAIEGPSGSGKSTLLNQLALIDTPTEGEYLIEGVAAGSLNDTARARLRSSTFAFIFQSFHLLAGRSVLDNVALGTLYRNLPEGRRRELALEALDFVNLGHKARQRVENLSGGERQRVAIARAIASGAPVVVADEPTGNLDTASGAAVMETLERLSAAGSTVIVVTHDPQVAARAGRRLRVLDGQVTEVSEQVTAEFGSGPIAAPVPEGRDSRVKWNEALRDVWCGLWTKPNRTLSLIGAVALGVALALTTAGLSQTAMYQVSDIFDAQRNQRVAMTSPMLDPLVSSSPVAEQASSTVSLDRLNDLAGVQEAAVMVVHSQAGVGATPEAAAGPTQAMVVGLVSGVVPRSLFQVDTGGSSIAQLAEDEVVVGAQLAAQLGLGPVLASPSLWVDGQTYRVAGVLRDPGLQVSLLNSVVFSEPVAASLSEFSYALAEIRVDPGAATQVAAQGPVAWIPADPEAVAVDAPPDPTTMRATIESSLSAMLLTLTGVALLAAVISLAGSMTMAVFQRTGEFGLRRAIGARRKHVTLLVLAESLVIGVLGGLAGVYLAVLAILGITIANQWQPVLEPWLIPVGVVGGTVIGVLGGLVASSRASRIEPSDALRQ